MQKVSKMPVIFRLPVLCCVVHMHFTNTHTLTHKTARRDFNLQLLPLYLIEKQSPK